MKSKPKMKTKKISTMKPNRHFSAFALPFILFVAGCGPDESATDATGVFESTEIIVSSEANGKILSLDIREGDRIEKDQIVGLIDSTQLHFSRLQLEASKVAVASGKPDMQALI